MRSRVVERVVTGSCTPEEAAAGLNVEPARIREWRDEFLSAGRRGLQPSVGTGVVGYALIALVALMSIFAVVALYSATFGWDSLSTTAPSWGTFGDYVGGVLNPWLSFLALLVLLWTLRFQSLELRYSREEMTDSRRALEVNAANTRRMLIEKTFFRLLQLYNDLLHAVQTTQHTREFTGVAALEKAHLDRKKLLGPVESAFGVLAELDSMTQDMTQERSDTDEPLFSASDLRRFERLLQRSVSDVERRMMKTLREPATGRE